MVIKEVPISLTSRQFELLAEFCRELSQAAFIGAFAAWLLPGTVGLDVQIGIYAFVKLISAGLTTIVVAVILQGRGGKNGPE